MAIIKYKMLQIVASMNSEEFIKNYSSKIYPEEYVSRYKKEEKIKNNLEVIVMIVLAVSILSSVSVTEGVVYILENGFGISEPSIPGFESVEGLILFLWITVIYFSIPKYIIRPIKNYESEVDISSKDYTTHQLAVGIEKCNNGSNEDLTAVIDGIDITVYENPKIGEYIDDYLSYVEDDLEYLQETYADFAELLFELLDKETDYNIMMLEYISNPDFNAYTLEEESEADMDDSVSYFEVIWEMLPISGFIGAYKSSWSLFLLAAMIGVASIDYFDTAIGTAILLISLTGVRLYDRRRWVVESNNDIF